MITKCKICNLENPENNHFWSCHHVSIKEYCLTYEPRFSLYDNNQIVFKNIESYFETDFNSKIEQNKWVKENSEKATDYFMNKIFERLKNGKNKYFPSSIELASLQFPNLEWFQSRDFCYNNNFDIPFIKQLITINEGPFRFFDIGKLKFKNQGFDFIRDSREQSVLNLPGEKGTLNFGDYHCPQSQWNKTYIERKSLQDLIGTVSSGLERFEKEIERAAKADSYLVVVVEESLKNALNFTYLKSMRRCKTKVQPSFVFHKIRYLMQKYINVQFVFSGGRLESENLIKQIYNCSQNPQYIDWQYFVEGGYN